MDGGPRFLAKPIDEKTGQRQVHAVYNAFSFQPEPLLCTYKVHCIDVVDIHPHEIEDTICVLHSLGLQQKQGHSHE